MHRPPQVLFRRMPPRSTSPGLVSKAPRIALPVLLLAAASPAHAAALGGCSPSEPALACKLQSILQALYLTAAILVLVLIGAILFAVQIYRKYRSDRSDLP